MKFKKTLIITAHPFEAGWVNKMAFIAKKLIENKGGECTVIDLYKADHQQVYHEGYYMPGHNVTAAKVYQEMLKDCSDLIVMYPLWWGSVPAILKNWMDVNFEPKFAYDYQKSSLWYKLSGLPHGKLAHIRTHQVVTAGGESWKYFLLGSFPTNTLRLIFIFYCGMKQGFAKMYGGIASTPLSERSRIVVDFEKWFEKKLS